MSEYPEHEKLRAVSDKSQTIGEFLEWLENRGVWLASYQSRDWLEPVRMERGIEGWLALFFGIDLAAIDREKEAMLEAIRNVQS